MGHDLTARLAAYLSARVERPVEVSGLNRLAGGASRETWAFDATIDGRPMPLILRLDPPGRPTTRDCADEGRLLRAAAAAGVPVPAVRWSESGSEALGAPFLVMERVEGETIPRRILRDTALTGARANLVGQCAAALARIHSVPLEEVAYLGEARSPLELLDAQKALLDSLHEPHPVFELALRWLAERARAGRPAALVHGDYRLGNVIVGPEGLRAILDWELAHAGDPAEDLGWFCVRAWRFGNDRLVAGGLGSQDDLVDAYVLAGGAPVDAQDLLFWEAYGTLRWGVMCVIQASVHLTGAVRSVELAAIGRRACEMEWALLDLLDQRAVRAPLPLPSPEAGGQGYASLQDRPTSPELLDAVAGFLEQDVAPLLDARLRFHARVAVNALQIVRREWEQGPAQRERQQELLGELLGHEGEPADLLVELARAIREGSLDGRRAEVVAVLREITAQKLAIANPGYTDHPTKPTGLAGTPEEAR